MLQELSITDFAIIQQIRLEFTSGLVIFTGETGAGKSIVLDAIGALLGDRMGADVVRAGAQRAVVEGVFALPWLPTLDTPPAEDVALASQGEDEEGGENRPDPRQELAQLLREYGLESGDDTIIITREVNQSGRTVARVNGRAVPVAVLGRIGSLLVDVHGQGAHLALLRAEQHINYLDRYAETLPQRQALGDAVRRWQALRRELATLRTSERELERRAELLRFQVDEIESAHLQPGEIDQLEQERVILNNAERLREESEVAHAALTGAEDGETSGVLDLLATAERTLADLARLDPALAEAKSQLDESRFQLEDVAATLRAYRDRAEADPERLAEIEERLDRISRLRRKYGATIEEILDYAAESAKELEQIERRDERIAELEDEIERHRVSLGRQAEALSQARQQSATRMSAAMEQALDRLNMQQARFFVQIERHLHPDGVPIEGDAQRVAITPTGIDRVEFLIAPNPGEPPRPLARIASGGETARLMLALKSILAEADATPTLIFDEVDAGISGITGQIVGEMLWQLARAHQVICVTHLPQLATFGDQHWHVAKRVAEGRTSTIVTELDAARRTLEIAQMLGGVATESAARNAAELLDRAATWKAGNASPSSNGVSVNGAKTTKSGGRKKARTAGDGM
jgi:DNA repair protein RecN (Recombination protein N)